MNNKLNGLSTARILHDNKGGAESALDMFVKARGVKPVAKKKLPTKIVKKVAKKVPTTPVKLDKVVSDYIEPSAKTKAKAAAEKNSPERAAAKAKFLKNKARKG